MECRAILSKARILQAPRVTATLESLAPFFFPPTRPQLLKQLFIEWTNVAKEKLTSTKGPRVCMMVDRLKKRQSGNGAITIAKLGIPGIYSLVRATRGTQVKTFGVIGVGSPEDIRFARWSTVLPFADFQPNRL
jgi:hypothetical protein